jgi:hypothetical protein
LDLVGSIGEQNDNINIVHAYGPKNTKSVFFSFIHEFAKKKKKKSEIFLLLSFFLSLGPHWIQTYIHAKKESRGEERREDICIPSPSSF